MNPRYVKELRLLVWPACVASLAVLSSWFPFLRVGDSQPGTFVFPVCIALIAAMSFGTEFQHRTLPLLLVQPIERSRLWWEKMAVLGGVAAFLGLLVWQVQGLANEFSDFHRALFNLFLFAGVCSAGFWVQKTRSTAVAFLLALAIQLVLFSGASLLFRLFLGPEPYPWDAGQARLLVLTAMIYCGAFLWLGWRFWKRRLRALVGLGLAILVFHWVTQSSLTHGEGGRPATADLALGAMFLLTTVCSTAFWTLPARSTIGGAVFNAAGQFLGVLILSLVLPKLHPALAVDGPYAAGVIVVGGLAYSLFLLWLGWRTFARLELKGVALGEGGDLSQQVGWRWPGMAWLKCGPQDGLVNLVRKELVLQRPTFLIAAVLVGCWLATLVVRLVAPEQRAVSQGLVSALAFICVPLILLLAGSVSLGEEKSLGIGAWHLTLPVGAWRQWWIKVGVSVASGLFLGVLLPGLLISVTAGFEHSEPIRILHPDSTELVVILLGAVLVVVISCWAAALFGTVVRATIGGMLALACLAGCASLSAWCVSGLGGLETDLVSSLGEGLGFPPGGLLYFTSPWLGGAVVMSALIPTALWQGFLQFRRAQVADRVWLRYSVILVFVALVTSAWYADLMASAAGFSDSALREELEPATQRLVATRPDFGPGKWQAIGLADLEGVASLSERAKARLRDTRISLMLMPSSAPRAPRICQVILAFPQGATQMFGFPLPGPDGK